MHPHRFGSLSRALVAVVVALAALAVPRLSDMSVDAQRAAGPAAPAPAPAGRGPQIGVPRQPIGDGPWIVDTAEQHKVRVSVVAKGLVNPWSLAWLPDGAMLVTERPGRLRLIRRTACSIPTPITGVPAVKAQRL